MIKKITVLNRQEIEYALRKPCPVTENDWALVSIWHHQELIHFIMRPVLKTINCVEALSIKFADLTKDEFDSVKHDPQYKDLKLFDKNDAKLIIDFIDKIHKLNVPELIVHCAAGISRSAAVGLWACRYLNLNENEFRDNHSHILPNVYVLSVLNEISGINKGYMDFWASAEMKTKREKLVRNLF